MPRTILGRVEKKGSLPMIILTKEDMKKAFSMREAIEADKEALKLLSLGKSDIPLRTNLAIPEHHGQSLFMPGYIAGGEPALGIKIISIYPANIDKGIPSAPSTMICLDAETGMVSAVMDGTYLTQLRTGAVQGAATDILANPDARIGALFGTGGQAATQLEAMLTVRPLREVRVYDLNRERCLQFAWDMDKKFSEIYGVAILPSSSPEEAVQDADIITTVTTSKTATFEARHVKKGAHINGVGAYTPEMHEIPAKLVQWADRIIFDTMEGVLAEAGDMIAPLKEGLVTYDRYQGELGQVLLGEVDGRLDREELTIFKTVGTAALDVYVADRILRKARELKIGTELPLD